MVRNVTKEESAPRHPIPRLAAGGTTNRAELEAWSHRPSLLRPEKASACPPGRLPTWLRPVVGQPRDGGGGGRP